MDEKKKTRYSMQVAFRIKKVTKKFVEFVQIIVER